jgi:hypothetical protein
MPEHVDSLTHADAVDRPNIFVAPAARIDDAALPADRAHHAGVFASAPAATPSEARTAVRRRAPSAARVSLPRARGISTRICICVAAVIAAAVVVLVLYEIGHGDSGPRTLAKTSRTADTGSPARPNAPAARRPHRAPKSEHRVHARIDGQGSSRSGRSAGRSRCCGRESVRRRGVRVAPGHRRLATPPAPTASTTPGPQPAGPAAPREHGTPAPVPMGAPPEFM